MLGSLYFDRPGWLHRWPAGAKLLAVLLLSTALFATRDPKVLGLLCGICVAPCAMLLRPGSPGRRPMGLAVVGAALVAVLHAVLGQPEVGWASAARLVAAAGLALSLTLSTRVEQLVAALDRVLAPLERLRWCPARMGLRIALVMRFTEHFFVKWQCLDEAHRLRTGKAGGLALVTPLCLQMLLTADRVADALTLRLTGDPVGCGFPNTPDSSQESCSHAH